MAEKLNSEETHVPIDEDNQVIADAIGNLATNLPSTSGLESLLQNQNEIFSSLLDLVRTSNQPDYTPYLVSFFSLIISVIAIYLSHWHKPSKAVLCLSSRFFNPIGNKTMRELSYTFSNTGNQELFVKEISILRGQSPLGNLKHNSSYLVIPSNVVNPFVIKPGEIKNFMVSHDTKYSLNNDLDEESNKYTIISLEVISAKGKRYQVTHDISKLGSSGPDIKDKIWRGVPLGRSI